MMEQETVSRIKGVKATLVAARDCETYFGDVTEFREQALHTRSVCLLELVPRSDLFSFLKQKRGGMHVMASRGRPIEIGLRDDRPRSRSKGMVETMPIGIEAGQNNRITVPAGIMCVWRNRGTSPASMLLIFFGTQCTIDENCSYGTTQNWIE